jgi:hypothetical protein
MPLSARIERSSAFLLPICGPRKPSVPFWTDRIETTRQAGAITRHSARGGSGLFFVPVVLDNPHEALSSRWGS